MPFNQNLTENQRRKVWKDLMKEASNKGEELSISKEDYKTLVDTADQWITDNVNGVFQAAPVEIRSQITAAQRAKIFLAVLDKKVKE